MLVIEAVDVVDVHRPVRVRGWGRRSGGEKIRDEENDDGGQAQAMVRSGVVDGILLDWWGAQDEDPDRLSVLQEIRQAIGPDALILVNSNWTIPASSAPYVNGLYMETTIPSTTTARRSR